MSKIIFSTKEITILQKNANRKRVSERPLHIQIPLKADLWMSICLHGFDVNIIRINRIEQSAYSRRKIITKMD